MDRPSTSSSSAKRTTREDEISLVGYVSHQIVSSKLPSNGQVLGSLFYNLRHVRLNRWDAARLTIQEVLIFWEKAKILTKPLNECTAQLRRLYHAWRNAQRAAASSKSPAQSRKVEHFESILDDLFDIARRDALEEAAEEDRQFLLLQREKGRRGTLRGVGNEFEKGQERKEKREAAQSRRLETPRIADLEENGNVETDSALKKGGERGRKDEWTDDVIDGNFPDKEEASPELKRRRYRGSDDEDISENLIFSFDKCSISDQERI